MDYGEILTDSLKLIWQENKLWVISLVGSALLALAFAAYYLGAFGGQMSMFALTMGTPDGAISPEMGDEVVKAAMIYALALVVAAVLGLIGYFLNLAARAGVVIEAARAWRGGQVDVKRGLRQGASKAITFFLLDLMWSLPLLIFMGFASVMGGLFFFQMMDNMIMEQPVEEPAIMPGVMLGAFAIMGLSFCLVFIYGIVKMIFSPMMYQVAGQEKMGVGESIRTGWHMARENLKIMIIAFIIVFAVQLVASVILQVVYLPLNFLLMGPMMQNMMRMAVEGAPPAMSAGVNWALVIVGALIAAFVTWLWVSFTQTFHLTFYARVYQELQEK